MRTRPWLLCAVLALALPSVACSSDDDDDDDDDTSTPNAFQENQSSYAGDYALDFLTDARYARLTVEIDYMEDPDTSDAIDNQPSSETIDYLLQSLNRFCRKTSITYDTTLSDVIPIPQTSDGSPQTTYTYDEVNRLERQYRDRYAQGDETILYFLYLNGTYITVDGQQTSVVGFAHHGSSMAVFKGLINSLPIAVTRPFYERTVVVHEVGHILGLVTTGIPAQSDHVDPDPNAAGVHCSNTSCLMYWAVNGSQLIDEIIKDEQRDFDQACQDDMAAAGGKNADARPVAPAEHGHAHEAAPMRPRHPHASDPFHPNVVY